MSSKSEEIRQLYLNTDLTVREIAEIVGVRYQFAYNVIRQLVDSRGEEVRKTRRRRTVRFSQEETTENPTGDIEDAEDMEEVEEVEEDEAEEVEEPRKEGELPRRRGHWTMPIVSHSKTVRERLERGESPEKVAEDLQVNLSFVRSVAKLLTGRRSPS